ncbi:MAG: FHA domain-containing protein, partial [Myxococcales bacterium]|nr:FHA domain-containing protein [Myxococcales bacterium]
MAVLLHLASGARHHLWMEHLVGRSRRCALRLDDGLVSSKHALLRWVDEQWVLRDLGSRNGTFLESQALRPGEQRALRVGDVIAFGRRDDPWRLDSDDPPVPMATPEDGGAPVFADSELLTLPDCDAPALVVLRDGEGRWIKERGDEVAPAVDQELVAIAGRVWRLHLPTSVDITAAPELVATIDAIAVRFVVSRDEEEVRVVVRWGAREHDLGVYAHHYTLLTLARLRIRDQVERGLPRDAQG